MTDTPPEATTTTATEPAPPAGPGVGDVVMAVYPDGSDPMPAIVTRVYPVAEGETRPRLDLAPLRPTAMHTDQWEPRG